MRPFARRLAGLGLGMGATPCRSLLLSQFHHRPFFTPPRPKAPGLRPHALDAIAVQLMWIASMAILWPDLDGARGDLGRRVAGGFSQSSKAAGWVLRTMANHIAVAFTHSYQTPVVSSGPHSFGPWRAFPAQ